MQDPICQVNYPINQVDGLKPGEPQLGVAFDVEAAIPRKGDKEVGSRTPLAN